MFSRGQLEVLKDRYHSRGHNNDYRNGNVGFGFVHYALIRNILASSNEDVRVLVIGSQKGYIPALCALACKEGEKGEVDFVDASYARGDKRAWGGLGIWKNIDHNYWQPLGVQNFINLFTKTTKDFFENEGKARMYDYVYIDGDHSYEGVESDYNYIFDHVKTNGYIVFHDILVDKTTSSGKCGVKQFWSDLCKRSEIANKIELPFDCGLGILQK